MKYNFFQYATGIHLVMAIRLCYRCDMLDKIDHSEHHNSFVAYWQDKLQSPLTEKDFKELQRSIKSSTKEDSLIDLVFVAYECHQNEVMREILEHFKNNNALNASLFKEIVSRNQPQMIDYLIKKGGFDQSVIETRILSEAVQGHSKEILKHMFNLNAKQNSAKEQAFIEAIVLNNLYAFEHFITCGVDINVHKGAALSVASAKDDKTMFDRLLKEGAKIYPFNHNDFINLVQRKGHDRVQKMIDNGADVYWQNGEAARRALVNEDVEMLSLLFEAGYNPHLSGIEWDATGAYKNNPEVKDCVHYYLSKYDHRVQLATVQHSEESQAVFAVRSNTYASYVRELLKSGQTVQFEDLLEADKYKNTILEMLCSRGHMETILTPHLWRGRETKAIEFFDQNLKGMVAPKDRPAYIGAIQRLTLQTQKNLRPKLKRRIR